VTELALTVLRLAFLGALWLFVLFAVVALRRDLRAPREARPIRVDYAELETVEARPSRPARAKRPRTRGARAQGAALVVEEGPLAGTVLPLGTDQVTIGRATDSTLIPDDDYVSSRHARIYPSEGVWIIEDLGSTNGTWVDRIRITGPTVLAVGTPVRIGRTMLRLQG